MFFIPHILPFPSFLFLMRFSETCIKTGRWKPSRPESDSVDTEAPLCGCKTLWSYSERRFYFYFFNLQMMNADASQIFWLVFTFFIWEPSRFLLNFNGSHKRRSLPRGWGPGGGLLPHFPLPNCNQSCVILYIFITGLYKCDAITLRYLTFNAPFPPLIHFYSQIKLISCISVKSVTHSLG